MGKSINLERVLAARLLWAGIIFFAIKLPVTMAEPLELALPMASDAGESARQRALVWKPDGKIDSVLICLHGIQTHAEWFGPLGQELASRATAVYALDRRGSGPWGKDEDSGHSEFRGDCTDWRLWIEDIQLAAKDIRKRHPNVPVFIVGISWGGKTALGALTDDPDNLFKGGILIAPAFKTEIDPGLPKSLGFLIGALTDPERKVDLEKKIGLKKSHYSELEATHNQWLENSPLVEKVTFRFLKESNAQLKHARKRINTIRVPVLALFGTGDILVKTFESDQVLLPLREDPASAEIGKARLTTVLLKCLTHASIVEEEKVLADMIRRWIEGISGRPAPEGELWMPAHATGFGVDEKGRSLARGREMREAPRGFSTGIEVTAGKPITIRRDPGILWQDSRLEPATFAGNGKEVWQMKLARHSLVLRRDENGEPLLYFALLALVRQADGKIAKSAVRFNDDGVAQWTPPASGKLSFLANDATWPSPKSIYSNNTGTLNLTIEP